MATSTFTQLRFPLPEATFFDFDIEPSIGNHLIRSRKAIHISQFRAQHGDRFRPTFWDTFESFDTRSVLHQAVQLLFQLSQIPSGMFQLITQDPQTRRTRSRGSSTTASSPGFFHEALGGRASVV